MVQAEGDGHTGPMRDSPSLDPLLAWSSHLTAPGEQVGMGTWGPGRRSMPLSKALRQAPEGTPGDQARPWPGCRVQVSPPEVNGRARAGVPAGLREGLGPGERPQAADPAKLQQPCGGRARAGREPSSKGTERRGDAGGGPGPTCPTLLLEGGVGGPTVLITSLLAPAPQNAAWGCPRSAGSASQGQTASFPGRHSPAMGAGSALEANGGRGGGP